MQRIGAPTLGIYGLFPWGDPGKAMLLPMRRASSTHRQGRVSERLKARTPAFWQGDQICVGALAQAGQTLMALGEDACPYPKTRSWRGCSKHLHWQRW